MTLLQAATECMYIFIRSQPGMVNTIPVSLFFCYNNEEHISLTLYTVHYTLYISDLQKKVSTFSQHGIHLFSLSCIAFQLRPDSVFVYETYSEYNHLLVFTRYYSFFIFLVLIYKIPHWKKSTTEYKERDKEHEEETIICRHYYAQRQAYFLIISVRYTLYWRYV